MNPAESIEDRIRLRAYQIWEHEGRPEGREHDHWERAVREIEAEMNSHASHPPHTGDGEAKLPPQPTD
jgi:hypothetical protein